MAAVGVDRLLGATSIVVRPLPRIRRRGASGCRRVLGCGRQSPTRSRSQATCRSPRVAVAVPSGGEPARSVRPVLVIDDSLTTRMLEQSILESAGYEVELATSAEEALGKAREKRYGLFLVDVEMPGMDGFEFVSRTQSRRSSSQDPCNPGDLRETPSKTAGAESRRARALTL